MTAGKLDLSDFAFDTNKLHDCRYLSFYNKANKCLVIMYIGELYLSFVLIWLEQSPNFGCSQEATIFDMCANFHDFVFIFL